MNKVETPQLSELTERKLPNPLILLAPAIVLSVINVLKIISSRIGSKRDDEPGGRVPLFQLYKQGAPHRSR